MNVGDNALPYGSPPPDTVPDPGRLAQETRRATALSDRLMARLDGDGPLPGAGIAPGAQDNDDAGAFDRLGLDGGSGLTKADIDRFADQRMASVSLATPGSLMQALLDSRLTPQQNAVMQATVARSGYAQARDAITPI